MRAPVLILGMHRSGTTMLVQLLTDLGFFAGAHLDPNAETWYLLRRNEWILRRAGGAWDHPTPCVRFLRNPAIRGQVVELLKTDIEQRFSEFVRGGLGSSVLEGPWGGKDPRLCFTLPIWREIFPDCRVILVRRNGVDVADSLVRRTGIDWDDGSAVSVKPLHRRIKSVWHPFEFLTNWSKTTRCFDLDSCFELWEEYVEAAERVFEEFEGEKLAINYEEMLQTPREHLAQAATFCGIEASDERVRTVTEQVDGSRRFAFQKDPELLEFYSKVENSTWMRRLGYAGLADVDQPNLSD